MPNYKNADFPMDEEGRTLHLHAKRGEVANRILSVGHGKRAELLASFLDNPKETFYLHSTRGFGIYTGLYKNVPVSIVATGMGIPMMDFVIRESRAVIDGPMAVVRLGTAGTPSDTVPPGAVIVATDGAIQVLRMADPFTHPQKDQTVLDCYNASGVVPADPELTNLLMSELKTALPDFADGGLNISADCYYGSQGRSSTDFEERNDGLLPALVAKHPTAKCIEMETFHMLHLAQCSRGSVRATGAAIVMAQRKTNAFLDSESLHRIEKAGGRACLDALIKLPLKEDELMKGPDCVWHPDNVKHGVRKVDI